MQLVRSGWPERCRFSGMEKSTKRPGQRLLADNDPANTKRRSAGTFGHKALIGRSGERVKPAIFNEKLPESD
jgi:hypothetical protein